MKAEIITIGDELLIGQTVDTNSAWIGAELSKLGFDIHRKSTIHDERSDILKVLSEASGRSDVVIITGGLGPTSDDITKQVLCEFFGTDLVIDNTVLDMIEKLMARRHVQMNENNRRQAEVPKSCKVLTNKVGTAPGMWFEKDRSVFISLPGVPYEMKHIMTEHVLDNLSKRFNSQTIIHRNIITYGAPESRLAERLETFEAGLPRSIKLAYLPSYGMIRLRLTCKGNEKELLEQQVAIQVKVLYSLIPDLIIAEETDSFEAIIGKLLRERNQTMCTAESCTGGRIAQLITTIPGSSGYFKGSVIAYSNTIKTRILGVPDALISKMGAVSEPVVKAMAEGALKLLDTDYALATSGIAGPDGGSPGKPVGTVWIAAASPAGTITEEHVYGTDRNTNIMRFSNAALNLLRNLIIRS